MIGLLMIALALQGTGVQRVPLAKQEFELTSPSSYQPRQIGEPPPTGEYGTYDHKPRIVPVDRKAGKYELRWIGYDGREKVIRYQRPDAVDVVVEAEAARSAGGRFIYRYTVHNLPSSSQSLSAFVAQNFADDVTWNESKGLLVGRMGSAVAKAKGGGNWVRFGFVGSGRRASAPGQRVELSLESSAPPGLVRCLAHGGIVMQGAGEEIPPELGSALPGQSIWPIGYTIGPVQELNAASTSTHCQYLRDALDRFREAGWMAPQASAWYAENLRPDRIESVRARVRHDLERGLVTTEVVSLILAIP